MSKNDRLMPPDLRERRNTAHSEFPADRRHHVPIVDAPHVPMDEYREGIERLLREHNSGVIIGETGSGKTTRIPNFLLDAYPDAKIAITQPRRVAARSVSGYVAARRGGEVGGEVGYQVRFDDQTTEGTRATFMTDGILLRELSFDPLLTKYDIVMVDEAHERSLNIDFVLGLLKRVQAEREKRGMPQLKVIATSATIERQKFANYFGSSPVIEVPGRMFPVDVQYEREPVQDYAKAAAELVTQIARGDQPGDVLIFMPGEEEIRKTIAEIKNCDIPGIDVMPLFSSMDPEDQDQIFKNNPKRKVIVATNIAETSLTIDGVRFVIDSGLIKQKEFDPSTGIEALLTRRHAKSGCEQRKGRAGRTAPGTCYRLYTEKDYNERQPFQTPEINRSNLDHVILAMKKIGIEDIRTFDFIDKPTDAAINGAIQTLKLLGALDDNARLTPMGETMAELPLRPELARMVIESEKFGCTGSITTIAAMFGEKSIFVRPEGKEQEADRAHREFKREGSDFLTVLEIWKQWSAAGFSNTWARDRYLNVHQLREVKETRAQLMRELKRQNIAVEDRDATPENIQKSVAAGLIQHLLIASVRYTYTRVVHDNGESILIHPSSATFRHGPRFMIGADVLRTTKTFARRCQPVKVEWLPDIAPQLLQEEHTTVAYNPRRDVVEETIEYSLKGGYSHATVVECQRDVTDKTRIRQEFVRALADGQVDLPASAHNTQVMNALKALRTRSGGMMALPDLRTFYEDHLGGATNRREAIYLNDRLQLNTHTYCPPEVQAEIDRLYPEVLTVAGHQLTVAYEYKPANPDSSYESDREETFTATITIPGDIIFPLNAEDIPEIGKGGRPAITYRSHDGYSTRSDSNLDNLKAELDKIRLHAAWYRFTQPEARNVQVGALATLPTPASLGLLPLAYTQDYRGNDVFAYPGYNVEERYRPDMGGRYYWYKIIYFQTESEAHDASDYATRRRQEEIDKERRRGDRETLMEPTLARYNDMRKTIHSILANPALHGFSTDDCQRVRGLWDEARFALEVSDADPRKAADIMNKLDRELADRRAERERRTAQVVQVRFEFATMAARVEHIDLRSHAQDGLTHDEYTAIRHKWREAHEALMDRDGRGPKIPDPEKARALMQEIAAMIPSAIEFRPEQEELMKLLLGPNASTANLIRVRNGVIAQHARALDPNAITTTPTSIPLTGQGYALVRGHTLICKFEGRDRDTIFKLEDGDYVFSDDAAVCIKVKETPGALYGFRAVQFVNPFGDKEKPGLHSRHPSTIQPVKPSATPTHLPQAERHQVASRSPSSENPRAVTALKRMLDLQNPQTPHPKPEVQKPRAPASISETVKPVEREKMTENVRADLMNILGSARIFLNAVRATPEPSDGTKHADKISRVRQRAKDAKNDLNDVAREVGTTDDAAMARGKVVEIARRAERLAEEMARLCNEREDWPSRFKQFAIRIGEIATALDIKVNDALRDTMGLKLTELAQRNGTIEDIDGALETILIESI